MSDNGLSVHTLKFESNVWIQRDETAVNLDKSCQLHASQKRTLFKHAFERIG
jgi:hypothetical protein